jgi:hypothetical protein
VTFAGIIAPDGKLYSLEEACKQASLATAPVGITPLTPDSPPPATVSASPASSASKVKRANLVALEDQKTRERNRAWYLELAEWHKTSLFLRQFDPTPRPRLRQDVVERAFDELEMECVGIDRGGRLWMELRIFFDALVSTRTALRSLCLWGPPGTLTSVVLMK